MTEHKTRKYYAFNNMKAVGEPNIQSSITIFFIPLVIAT